MEMKNKSSKISFTASTGVAACNIGGLTIHSWSGVGIASETVDILLSKLARNQPAKLRWKRTEILVIDEVSMITSGLMDKLSEIGKRMRNDPRPFGGLQLVLCGDFYQLPPIGLGNTGIGFAFESMSWQQLFGSNNTASGRMIVLDKVFRQATDDQFLSILNEIRIGHVSDEARSLFYAKVDHASREDAVAEYGGNSSGASLGMSGMVTKLCPVNREVDAINEMEMKKLANSQPDTAEFVTYRAIDTGAEPFVTQLRKGMKVPAILELRVGAHVSVPSCVCVPSCFLSQLDRGFHILLCNVVV